MQDGPEGHRVEAVPKPYQSGWSGHWLKVNDPGSPAMVRQSAHGDRYDQKRPYLCPLDQERGGGQHVANLHANVTLVADFR
jgi:hypothetical protein